MKESEILAHAEARANGLAEGERPTEADFQQAEQEVREMVAEGAFYSEQLGWTWPNPNIGPRPHAHEISTWTCWRDAAHEVTTSKFGWPQCTVCRAAPPYHERPDWLPNDFELGIYVPNTASWKGTAIIAPRSGVVGLPAGGDWIDISYEGWINGPMQYGDRDARGLWEAGIEHAAGRMITDYPTIARAHLPSNSLVRIGLYYPKTRLVGLFSEGEDRLSEWLEAS